MQPLMTGFDGHVPPALAHVAETAEVLAIREIEVFAHAHRWWYQRPLSDGAVSTLFGEYLCEGRVPPWVRHYCRRVLSLADVGQLDPADFGVDAPTVRRPRPSEQRFAGLVTVAVFMVYMLFLA